MAKFSLAIYRLGKDRVLRFCVFGAMQKLKNRVSHVPASHRILADDGMFHPTISIAYYLEIW